jgi:signal peptidase I
MIAMLQVEPLSINKTGTTKRRSVVSEWLRSVLFAVVAATLIRWFFFSAFVIPTPSMENSLLVGDYLFVSKLHYGAATPITPLQLPLAHQTVWGTDIPAYLDWIKLPQFRLPGFTDVKRGDVVVFNLPVEHPDLYQKYGTVLPNLRPHPVDQRTNYIKRCIAQPGDQLVIKDGQTFVNGTPGIDPARMQSEYFVSTTGPVNETNVFRKKGVHEFSAYTETFGDTNHSNDVFGYILYTTKAIAESLKSHDFVKSITRIFAQSGQKESYIYPDYRALRWNKDQYGPILVPGKGTTIHLTALNVALYGEVIKCYEGNKDVRLDGDNIFLDEKIIKKYTFQQDYYFMMGDNRHQSADSRYWGFVPRDHIVGKAVFVWMSIDPNPVRLIDKLRWNRLFRVIQ